MGESDDAQVGLVLFLSLLRLTGDLGSKSMWPLSKKSALANPIVVPSGDNFGKLWILRCITGLTRLRRCRRPGRYLIQILSVPGRAETGE